MTEYVEIRAPLKEVKIAWAARHVRRKSSLIRRMRSSGGKVGRVMQCPMCSTEIDSATVAALGLFMRAVGQARSPMSVIVRRAVA